RRFYARRAARLMEALERHLPSWRFAEPEGGFSIWVEPDGEGDDAALLSIAVDEGVGFDPGRCFRAGPGPLALRLCYSAVDECRRAETLGVGQVIVHPGAAVGGSVAEGIRNVSRSLRSICAELRGKRVRLLLEFTAGQGSCVGCSFEQLAEMLKQTGERRLGVCLDTQHLYAAGIEWTTARGYDQTFADFDRIIGLRHLEAFHLNDSKRPLGSRVDRHAVIGEGFIGVKPFARL